MTNDVDSKVKGYQRTFAKHGRTAKALQWGSDEAAERRYKEIVADVDFKGKTILDVGCGFGDIIPFIEEKARHFEYKGVDVVPEFIETAKKRHPGYEFEVGDFFGNPGDVKYDIVMTSGTLNAKDDDAMDFRKKAIKTMFENAKEAVIFNMAGNYPQPKSKEDGKVYYADSTEVLEYCLTLTKKVIFRHHYHDKDFTLALFK